jgi:hypothetical protein
MSLRENSVLKVKWKMSVINAKLGLLGLALTLVLTISATAKTYPVGDLNQDFSVDVSDLTILADQWLYNISCSGINCAEIDGLLGVNLLDFALMAEDWFGDFGLPLVINEFMASNSTDSGIGDPQGDFDDWIEIHNFGETAIDVGGMYLSDDLANPTAWQFPDDQPTETTIDPNGFIVVWADGDVTDTPGLHTNFKLRASGEEIAFTDTDGTTLIDGFTFSEQFTDLSYGRWPNAYRDWRYMGTPTPGAQNSDGYLGIVEDVDISHLRGFYDSAFEVELTCETDDVVIYYTINGSKPNQMTGMVYNPAVKIPITTTTCLRAAAFKAGYQSSQVNTCTYLFLGDIKTQSNTDAYARGFPIQWYNRWNQYLRDGDYAMDPDVLTNPIYYANFETAMKAIPVLSIVTNIDNLFDPQTGIYVNNWSYHDLLNGQDWEREISLEFFESNSREDFQVDAGLRLSGNQSRDPRLNAKHSMRIFFKNEFGPGMLDFPFYQNTGAERVNNISLRSNYHWNWMDVESGVASGAQYLRDTFAQDSIRDMGYLSPDSRFAHVYMNGLYWGLYQASERPDGPFMAEHTGGEREDYDVIEGTLSGVEGVTVKEGNRDSWDYMQSLFAPYDYDTPMSASDYAELTQHLDMVQFCDYIIYNTFVTNWDWNSKNWYAASMRNPDDVDGPPLRKWTFFPWDSEESMWNYYYFHPFPFEGYYDKGAGKMHNALHNNPDYNRLLGDRVHKLLVNNGTMTAQKCIDRYEIRAQQIEDAVLAESARWGDFAQDNKTPDGGGSYPLFTPAYWDNERDRMINPDHPIEEGLAPYLPNRTDWLIVDGYPSRGFYPSVAAPSFSQFGGEIAGGASVTITGSGIIYYTTDGSEPADSGTVITSGSSVTINHSLILKARADYGGGNWSALNEAAFAVGSVVDHLRITEIMYHPLDTISNGTNDPDLEYIELKNIGSSALNLNLVKFSDGIHFIFPDLSLAAGDHILVVKDQTAFEAEYGSGKNIAGQWSGPFSGRLANDGERIRLEDAIGRIILDFSYKDDWRDITDGEGFSLNIFNPSDSNAQRWNDKANWCASTFAGGTPDADDNSLLKEHSIVINELCAHTDVSPNDWIELYNTTDFPISIGGWYLSDNNDDEASLMKYQIAAGTELPVGGYLVLTEDTNFGTLSSDPGKDTAFALSEFGEVVYLTSSSGGQLTGYREREDFDSSENSVSFGRHTKSTGTSNFVAMSANTSGTANAYPKVGPIIINEIMYNPASGGQNEEYIELYNITSSTVNLYSATNVPWKFTDGIKYTFPAGTSIPPHGYLLVVKTTPAYFLTKYPTVPGGIQVLGSYEGYLSNSGEKLELGMPGDIDELGEQHYIRVDRVTYSDGSHPDDSFSSDPWPVSADGDGDSLHQKTPDNAGANYGNDVINWQALAPNPGQ